MGLKEHTEKKVENYFIGSRQKLRASMRHKIKRTFVGCLGAIEKELGIPQDNTHEELFKRLRGQILSLGNDQIRNMEAELERYNIEFIPYQFTIMPLEKEISAERQEGE